jgi:hypothetical protein
VGHRREQALPYDPSSARSFPTAGSYASTAGMPEIEDDQTEVTLRVPLARLQPGPIEVQEPGDGGSQAEQ